MVNRIEATLR